MVSLTRLSSNGNAGPAPLAFRLRHPHERIIKFEMFCTEDTKRKHSQLLKALREAALINRCAYQFEFVPDMLTFQSSLSKLQVNGNRRILCTRHEVRHWREVSAFVWRTHAADARCVALVSVASEFYQQLGMVEV